MSRTHSTVPKDARLLHVAQASQAVGLFAMSVGLVLWAQDRHVPLHLVASRNWSILFGYPESILGG
jgi:hypothetical protein